MILCIIAFYHASYSYIGCRSPNASPRSQECLALPLVCDGKEDCPSGEDEVKCFALHPIIGTINEEEPIDTSLVVVDLDAFGYVVTNKLESIVVLMVINYSFVTCSFLINI